MTATAGAAEAALAIQKRLPGFAPRLAVVLGSGLAAAADVVEPAAAIACEDLPDFPRPSVEGHPGRLVIGRVAGVPAAVLVGRTHPYEAGRLDAMAAPIRAFRLLGAEVLHLTGTAGSLRPEVGPGRLMMVTDHLNLMGGSPLAGPNDDAFGPRFPAMTEAYDPALQAAQRESAAGAGIDLAEGVYAGMPGPQFETPAEIRMLAALGADAVGMSLVPECILARHCGLRVAATAVVANPAAGLGPPPDHAGTLAAGAAAAEALGRLLDGLARRL
jgi:xanthosine phosphorylase